jgi:hypothetical protein
MLMKRKASTLTLILTLLLSLLIGISLVKLGTANPMLWLLGFPSSPVQTPPEIVFQSPINQTYDSNSMWLNFTIVKPESWFFVANNISPNNYIYVNITSISYTVDGITNESIPVSDVTDLLVEYSPDRSLNFSTKLTLPEGPHNLTVNLQRDSYYVDRAFTSLYPSNIQMNFTSEVMYFTVTTSTPTSTPTMLVIVPMVSVAVVGIVLLVYFKKRKH